MRLTVPEYAKRRGVSRQAVMKAARTGRITKGIDGKVDPDEADAEWEANTDVSTPQGRQRPARARAGAGDGRLTLAEAQAERMRQQAELARLEVEKRKGVLVDRVEVEREAFRLARALRDGVMAVPQRVAATLGLPVEAEKMIEDELRSVLERLE